MKMTKRILSFALCLVMLVGLLPQFTFAADGVSAQANDGPIYVLAGGDFQAGDNGKEDHYYSRINMGNILDKIKEKYSAMNGFIFVGDYDGDTHYDSNANAGVAAMMEEVSERFGTLNHDNSYLIEGNHESGAVSGIDRTGGYDCNGYAVYLINETDFCERQEGKSTQIQTVANNLKTWLNNKVGEAYDAPIFVATHTPLGYTTRTYTNGDSLYGKYVFDVLNDAAANGLNIIFMHGHDHAYGADNYLGGEAIYLPVGDKINICVPGDKTKWTEETLNFTYMNAGYVGYYNENYYNVNSYEAEKLTMTVFKIENNQVTVERWSKDGLYNLKSAGREGFYANGGTCAGIGLAYNTTVYASPQTIALRASSNDAVGTIGTWVNAGLVEDVTTSGNKWVTINAATNGTAGTEATYEYVLDTNGIDAGSGNKYIIVARNAAYLLDAGNAVNITGSINGTTITLNTQKYEYYFTGSTSGLITRDGTNTLYQSYWGIHVGNDSGSNLDAFVNLGNGYYRLYDNDGTNRALFFTNTAYEEAAANSFTVTNDRNTPSTTSTNNTYSVRLFKYNKTNPGTAATPGSNGLFGYLKGELVYTVAPGTSREAAIAAVQQGIAVQYTTYEDYSNVQTLDDDNAEGMSWSLDATYDGTASGDFAVTISYNGTVLGTAKVIVPTSTYYIAEGKGMYTVPMHTSEENAMAAVMAGVTVSSATDDQGANKATIDDAKVTWEWVDKYDATDNGPYTVEILYNGTSLGTVEVKVDVKYTNEIKDWTNVGTTEAGYKYVLDTDGVDYNTSATNSSNRYIIVAADTNKALASTPTGTVDVTISGDTAIIGSRAHEYHFYNRTSYTGRGIYICNGSGSYLYHGNYVFSLSTNRYNRAWTSFTHNGDGLYTLLGQDNNGAWKMYYSSSNGDFRVQTASSNVRLYKYAGQVAASTLYAHLEGNTVYTIEQGKAASAALNKVKAGITGYLSSNADGSNATEMEDKALTWKWLNTYKGSVPGSYWVEISYKGTVLGTVEVKVEPGTVNNYPEYPDEGAVKVNKTGTGIQFQSTGVAQVELSASGVPSKKGADVIIMVDTSSSMNTCITHGKRDCTDSACQGNYRSHVFEASLKDLIAKFKTPGEDGQMLDMRVAIADFNGFDKDTDKYPWSWNPKDILADDVQYDATNYGTVYTGPNANSRDLTASAFVAVDDLKDSYSFAYHSGTNYDYAFDVIYQLATAIKATNSEDRDLYVIFMSDGAPMQYNYYHSNGRSDLLQYYLQGQITQTSSLSYRYDGQEYNSYQTATGYGAFKSGANTAYYHPEGKHWMAEAIKGDPAKDYKVIRKGIEGADENGFITINGLGAKMFSIAFCPAVDQHTPVVAMTHVLESIASEQTGTTQYYYNVNTAAQLTNAFAAIGTEIAYAASNARFVDQMGPNFNLQMTPIVDYAGNAIKDGNGNAMLPSIEIISYDIWTRADYEANKCTIDQIGVRKGTYKILETVTFTSVKNTDGSYTVTGAYSDQIGGGATNILADGTQTGYVKGVIYAKTFIYNTNAIGVTVDGVSIPVGVNSDGTTNATTTNVLPAETFYWKLGTVQTSELAMRYYVYLDGSMEGTRPAGSYATNNYAILYYDNYLGNSCLKETVSPVMAWKSANVSYAFYLVNEKGEIIVNQTTGEIGTFANKIAVTNPVVYDEIMLNNTQQVQSINVAAISDNVLPKYYNLYDEGAVYEIHINSDATGNWAITKGDVTTASTYVTNYTLGTAYSNALTENSSAYDYTHTVVWFAVVWTVEAHPDSVVVDFGLPVDISVLANDMFGDYGKLAGIGPYYLKDEAGNLTGETNEALLTGNKSTLASNFSNEWTGTYGTAKVDMNTGKIRYTLNTMSMNGYDKFAYAVNYTGATNPGYYYDTVTVIPATTIYYEDSFLTFAGSNTAWEDEGTAVNGATQDEDRPGKYSLTDANNIYGYDSVNKGMATFSMGTAKKVHVDANSYATATFTFTGTGFDVISMTSNTTGTIAVKVTAAEVIEVNGVVKYAKDAKVKAIIVDTYYGYTQDAEGNWVAEPDVAKSIYQVPVLQIEELPYGKYNVTITATYGAAYDHTTEAGYDLYLDAIRIYDPANDGAVDGSTDTTIEDAYKADGEGWPSYIELRNKLIYAATLGNEATDTKVEGLVFIDGDTSVGDAQIADYKNYGPNNEVYLAPGQRVAFILELPGNVKNIHIGLKSANGEDVTYTITNIAQMADPDNNITAGQWYNAKTYTLDTTTDMYYDMTGHCDITGQRKDIIVVSNTGDRYNTSGILSITNIKFAYTSDPNAPANTDVETASVLSLAAAADETEATGEASVYMTPRAAMLTLRAVNTMYLPEVFEPEQMEVSVNRDHVKEGDKVKVTVKTSDDVAYITVNGEAVTRYKTNRRTGVRTWEVTLKAEEAGEMNVEVVAYDADDLASDPVAQTVTVEAKKDPKQVAKEILKGLLGRFFG